VARFLRGDGERVGHAHRIVLAAVALRPREIGTSLMIGRAHGSLLFLFTVLFVGRFAPAGHAHLDLLRCQAADVSGVPLSRGSGRSLALVRVTHDRPRRLVGRSEPRRKAAHEQRNLRRLGDGLSTRCKIFEQGHARFHWCVGSDLSVGAQRSASRLLLCRSGGSSSCCSRPSSDCP
jgi:hypothetical protein